VSERRYAVLIGSSQFPDEPKLLPLRAPENDVDGLYEILKPKDLGNFTEISVLKNKSSHEAEIAILSVLSQAEKNDLVVIYYSGHGKLDPAGRLHLAMANTRLNVLGATSIPVSRIRDFVDNSPSNKVVLILDCCYSGAAGGVFARGSLDDQLQLASGGRGTYIMTASTAIQIAQEKPDDQYGLFTKKIIEGIRSGKADLNEDGNVTMDELYSYVHREMLDEGFQEPMKWDLNVRGELVIVRTGKAPREERRKAIRRKLLDLEGNDLLPHRVLVEALEFLNRTSSEGSAANRPYDLLLSQLLEGQLRIGDFIGGWYEISKPSRERKDLDAEIRPGTTSTPFPEAETVEGPVADFNRNSTVDVIPEVTGHTMPISPTLPKKTPFRAWRKTVIGTTSVGLLISGIAVWQISEHFSKLSASPGISRVELWPNGKPKSLTTKGGIRIDFSDSGSVTSVSSDSGPLSPQAVRDIVEQVKKAWSGPSEAPELTDGQVQAPQAPPPALDPALRTFIVDSDLAALANGRECTLTGGDVLTRLTDTPDADQTVKVSIAASKKGDCAPGQTVAVKVDDLQEMHNRFREQIDEGLRELEKKE
jgi:hypothetical protein